MTAFYLLPSSKTQDFSSPLPGGRRLRTSRPQDPERARRLAAFLGALNEVDLGSLLGISARLAMETRGHYAAWGAPGNLHRPALLAYAGDLYQGLDALNLDVEALQFAQARLFLFSGLYGLLRSLDEIEPYRLEMGARVATSGAKDLYGFWGEAPTRLLAAHMAQATAPVLVNLASQEYTKALRPRLLPGPVITPVFQERKGEGYKVVSFFAKRARGLMARYALLRRIETPKLLQDFREEDYAFCPEASTEDTWVFRRG